MSQKNCFQVAKNIWGLKDVFVNVYFVKDEASENWVLIDTGISSTHKKIKTVAGELFGKPPSAIVLTHGHGDHAGSLNKLLEEWHVPVYCHYMEMPYLTGKSSYPPPDSSVGGGLMASVADVFSPKPITIQGNLNPLPEDGSVPHLSGWIYINTPGHAPGHVSLFREDDKVLIAGDAFVTTKQESVYSVMLQKQQVSRPPAYFTYDWAAAADSIKKLKMLAPEVAATGHGKPMHGKELRTQLQHMHEHFFEKAVPNKGRYIYEPAVADANGVLYVPPATYNPYTKWIVRGSVVAAGFITAFIIVNRQRKKHWFAKLVDDGADLLHSVQKLAS